MFQRFTETGRQVVVLAQEEARALKHDYIGTEHLLLGLLREEEGLAARVLDSLDITVERVRTQVVRIVGSGDEFTSGELPSTPRVKRVLELALGEAHSLGHGYIGTEHLLLALGREGEGVAARVLVAFAASPKWVRQEVIRMLAGPGGRRRWTGGHRLPADSGLPDTLVEGASRMLKIVSREIEQLLDRPADAGDLFVALAALPEGLVARTVAKLGIDAATLKQAVDAARREGAHPGLLPPPELVAELEDVRSEKHAKLAAHQFEGAAKLRDRERQLVTQAGDMEDERLEAALAEVRRQLGLAGD